jgi:formiminoglutamase
MINLDLYTKDYIAQFVQKRAHETKFGEEIETITALADLQAHPAEYVLLGIPEDIGIRANKGKAGAAKTWEVFLNSFLNIQTNIYNNPKNLILLGEINCKAWMQKASSIPKTDEHYHQKLGGIVEKIDEAVADVIQKIVESGKIPIVIGGGHNNAYGIIKGCSKATQKPINVANIDAHTDLRPMDFRHSGNGFSYAMTENYLDRYSIFGIHRNYTSQAIFDSMDANKKIMYHLFEDCLHLTSLDKLVKMKSSLDFLKGQFGMELDCDAIHNINSSAVTPSGFSLNVMRSFMKLIRKHKIHYLHICEAAPHEYSLIGKTLSYLVSDFIRKEE